MNRRKFLKAAAGLAVVAVAAPVLAVPESDRERLLRQIKDGAVIEDQTFYLDVGGPVVIRNVNGLLIRRCHFIWTRRHDGLLLCVLGRCNGITIADCSFDARGLCRRGIA